MSLLHAIGFEWGVLEDGITVSATGTGFNTTYKRTGNRSYYISGGLQDFYTWMKLPLTSALSEFFYQFCIYVAGYNSANTARPILKWCYGTNVLGGLKLDPTTQKLSVWTGNFSTKVADGNTQILAGRWYVLEVHVKIADAPDGIIELRLDMIQEASFSGDTKPGTDTSVNNLVHGNIDGITSNYCYLDDLIVHDINGSVNNSWPNGAKVTLLLPDSDGSTLEWTPTPSGSHYTTVDEIPPSGSDYLQATATDKVDELGLQDLPSEALSVKGVILQTWALKGSTSPPTKLAMGLDLGGTDYFGSDHDLGTSQGLIKEIWEEKPGGGGFSVSDVNNAKFLLKSRQ